MSGDCTREARGPFTEQGNIRPCVATRQPFAADPCLLEQALEASGLDVSPFSTCGYDLVGGVDYGEGADGALGNYGNPRGIQGPNPAMCMRQTEVNLPKSAKRSIADHGMARNQGPGPSIGADCPANGRISRCVSL